MKNQKRWSVLQQCLAGEEKMHRMHSDWKNMSVDQRRVFSRYCGQLAEYALHHMFQESDAKTEREIMGVYCSASAFRLSSMFEKGDELEFDFELEYSV